MIMRLFNKNNTLLSNDVKVLIVYFIIIFINFLFVLKYSARLTKHNVLVALVSILFYFIIIKFYKFIKLNHKLIFWLMSFFLFSLAIFAHYKLSLASLNVDRWSVITSFFDELFKGHYPYFAKSHLGNPPGPMPMYFLIAFPFYIIKMLSLLSVMGYFIFLTLKKDFKEYPLVVFLLFLSPFLYWEIMTRSNIFTYTTLMLLGIIFYLHTNYKLWASFILGLLLATRSVFVLPLIVLLIGQLIRKKITFKAFIKQGVFITLGLIFTFIPLLLKYPKEFFEMNPFLVQSTFFIPFYYILIFMVLAFILSFFVKNKGDYYFYGGLSMFLAILIYSLYHIIRVGFTEATMNSIVDISYFILAIPFLFYYLYTINSGKNSKVNLNL